MDIYSACLPNDIYYSDDYIKLYLKDGEELFSFEYYEQEKSFISKSIKRPIKKIGTHLIEDGYYDLETAYGYGGFYSNCTDNQFISRAMEKYVQKCMSEKIIAEFIRFHPFNKFPVNNNSFLDFNIHDRDVVIKNTEIPVLPSYKSKIRNTIKRAHEKIIIQESQDYNKFITIYNSTMDKNSADSFYYFNASYYQQLLKNPSIKLYEAIHENETIAMGFFMFGKEIAHYHLSANTPNSYQLNANYALLDHAFNVANTRGNNYFLLGGGTTSQVDDTLFRFKRKFSNETLPFYISGKIYNPDMYTKYNDLWLNQSNNNIKYFLKYRLEII